MPSAVIAIRESRLVWRLNLIARVITLATAAVLVSYGVWVAAAAAVLIFIVGWAQKRQAGSAVCLGDDLTIESDQSPEPHPVASNESSAAFESAFAAFGLLILQFRGGGRRTVVVAPDSATSTVRREIGLWLKMMSSKTNSNADQRS
jgi:hypothetical protein